VVLRGGLTHGTVLYFLLNDNAMCQVQIQQVIGVRIIYANECLIIVLKKQCTYLATRSNKLNRGYSHFDYISVF